jgi:hypothetical protein
MKPYGVKKQDAGCCPGHDEYPNEHYRITSTKNKKRSQKPRKTRERMSIKRKLLKFLGMG